MENTGKGGPHLINVGVGLLNVSMRLMNVAVGLTNVGVGLTNVGVGQSLSVASALFLFKVEAFLRSSTEADDQAHILWWT